MGTGWLYFKNGKDANRKDKGIVKRNRMKNIVIYARYSSHQQSEQSIEGQLRDCYKYAEQNGYLVIREYIDRALSARTDNRPQFRQMIADAELGEFEAVLVWKLDRFSRDRYDSAVYKAKLKKNKVSVISCMENISGNAEGILLESLLEGFAEYFSADLAEKVTRGMKESASKLKCIGPLPLGYKSDANKDIIIDDKYAPLIKDIFHMFASGHNSRYVADAVNDKGYRTKRGNRFKVESILDIVHNHRYKGIYDFNNVYEVDAIPQIIDADLFDKANDNVRVNKRKRTKTDMKVNYLLSGKCTCGYCKNSLVGESGTSTNGVHYYYKCSTLKRHLGDCECKTHKKEYLESLVLQSITQDILNDETIQKIVNMCMQIQKEQDINSEENQLLAQQKECEAKAQNILKAIEEGHAIKLMSQQLEKIENQLESIEHALKDLKLKKHILNPLEIETFLNGLKSANIDDERIRRQLVASFLKEVIVYNEKIELVYTLIEGNSTNSIWYTISDENRTIYFDGKHLHHIIYKKSTAI